MNPKKLIKLLNLTASTNDAEALAAIRKANDEINESSWEELIFSTNPVLQGQETVNQIDINMENIHDPRAFSLYRKVKNRR